MMRNRLITPLMLDSNVAHIGYETPVWQVSEAVDGIACHSLSVYGPAMLERARTLAYERIATLTSGTLLHPPGIVGRGDHAYVELHVRSRALTVEAIAVDPIDPKPAA